jgi:hypothetical protein
MSPNHRQPSPPMWLTAIGQPHAASTISSIRPPLSTCSPALKGFASFTERAISAFRAGQSPALQKESPQRGGAGWSPRSREGLREDPADRVSTTKVLQQFREPGDMSYSASEREASHWRTAFKSGARDHPRPTMRCIAYGAHAGRSQVGFTWREGR